MASGNPSGLTRRLRRVGPMAGGFLSLLLTFGLAACGDTLYEPDTQVTDTTTVPDTIPSGALPAVQVTVQAPGGRIELTDSIIVQVRAWDPGRRGIDLAGYTAVIKSNGVERSVTGEMTFPGTPRDTVVATFSFKPTWLQPSDLPSNLAIEVYGNARNTAGVCGAAVPGSPQVFDCQGRNVAGISVIVATTRAADLPVVVVRGRTTQFSGQALLIGDLAVDTLRSRAYLSNRVSSQLIVFDPVGFRFTNDVSVGSEPWGLHMNAGGDTLLVANSGGTSVSHVSLSGTPREAVERRVQTRNTPLFEVKLKITVDTLPDGTEIADTLTQSVLGLDFSDRPQYVAKDADGRILYSTRPTLAAPRGTVRIVSNEDGWEEHETRMLVRIPEDTELSEGTVVVMNADSVYYYRDGLMEVWDHTPGFPDDVITSGAQRPMDALRTIYFLTGSDVDFLVDSKWNLEAVSFADTTYVAISRNRGYVAFGDGGQPGVGRVVVWHSESSTITRRLLVADLLNNASERVRALELNRDGSLGIARGSFGTYFFSKDLRLRGSVPEGATGGGGAALHPDHPDTPAPLASSNVTLAFTMSGDRTLRILDTVHYRERGRILLRDAISGPMRVSPPLPSDNGGQGRNCAGLNCIVAKVFAVTSSGGVVVIDVRASDISTLP
jgi:hypothetical protein